MTLLILGCMLLPFLPGQYDGLAVSLSFMAQGIAVAGLLLVPLGLIWLAHELRNRRRNAEPPSGKKTEYGLALASIGVATVIAVVAAMAAFVSGALVLGICITVLWTYCAARLAAGARARSTAETRSFNAVPLYLVVVPLAAAILRMVALGPASEFSRQRAIENSAGLIRDIERYRDTHGRYPQSLLAVHKDYKPSVIGVEGYHYEPNGDAYNVYFEHLSSIVGTREFVMYNKLGEHQMTSHAMDLLALSPAELAVRRGYYAVLNTSNAHWKRFLFD